MNQVGVRTLAFLLLCILMVAAGALGLVGVITASPDLVTLVMFALVAVAFYAGSFYSRRLA